MTYENTNSGLTSLTNFAYYLVLPAGLEPVYPPIMSRTHIPLMLEEYYLVHQAGFEPACPKAIDFKSIAYTNFATGA